MKRNLMKRTVSVLLCLALLLGAAIPALAAVKVVPAEEKEAWVAYFNDSVNPIKTDTPRAKVKFNNFVPDDGLTMSSDEGADPVDAELRKYLIPLLEGMFNTRSSTSRAFIQTMLGTGGNAAETLELHRTQLRDKAIPVYGEPYVSALTAADDFDIVLDIADGKKTPDQMAIVFQNCTLEEARASSIGKAFYLPSGALNPMIVTGERSKYAARLDKAQLGDFSIKDARLVAKYDRNGALTYYGSTIKYSFSISFTDCMNLLSAILGYDFYQATLNAVNVILTNLNRENVTPESVLGERKIFVTYCSTVEITDIDFSHRYFGDIDDDGRVTTADARAALRHAIGLDLISSSDDQIFTDVDFDGNITTADARLILRMAISRDPLFTDVPEGKKIQIVQIEEEPETPELPAPEDGDESIWFDDFDPILKLSDIVEAVFNYIGIVEDAEGQTQDYISQFIDAIRNAVQDENENKP